MNNFKNIKTGDLLYVSGRGPIAWLIKKLTKGQMSHVGIIYDERLVFETEGRWLKAQLFPVTKYLKSRIFVRRLKSMSDGQRLTVKNLCEKYNNKPYSYLDILLNAVAAPMPDKWRKAFVSKLGNKAFARCGELSRRIVYEATTYEPYQDFEASNPSETFKDGEKSGDFEVIIL